MPKKQQVKKPNLTPLQATIILARRGNKEILPRLRKVLDNQPELWQHFGNLTLQTQENWLQLIAGKDLYLSESLRRHLDSLRNDLAGPTSNPLERLLIDRILACQVQVLYFDAHEGQNPGGQNLKLDRYRLERQDQAHRQFLSAVKTLATVRQLAAKAIQVELIHRHAVAAPTASLIGGAYGEQPMPHNRLGGSFDSEPTKPLNGRNRINGHGLCKRAELEESAVP